MSAPDPALGVFLHALGGIGAASFYLPLMRVRHWAWESYWLIQGLIIWIIAPWILAVLTTPRFADVLSATPASAWTTAILLGAGWGVGNLTFGLSLRYLGLSLGYGLTLGFCTFFAAMMPPLLDGSLLELLRVPSGQTTMCGVLACLFGIALCGRAGILKERELSSEAKQATIREFNFVKGALVALLAGIASSCINFAITNKEPISALALEYGADQVWKNSATMAIFLTAGGLVNILWCLVRNVQNGTTRDYVDAKGASLTRNYWLCLVAGVMAYSEFLFYGMGETQMGEYSFTNLPIHLAFVIVFSSVWGMLLAEWKGTSRMAKSLLLGSLVVLIASAALMGWGTHLQEKESSAVSTSPITVEP